jgi:hypothetical protein
MHLRGPMNVSQLAVYQLPGDMHALQKRNTVPFYDRHRTLHRREPRETLQSHSKDIFQSRLDDRRTFNTTTSCSPRIITTTVTVTDCESHQTMYTAAPAQNTSDIGPSLSCLLPLERFSSDVGTLRSLPPATTVSEQPSVTSTPRPAKAASHPPERGSERRAGADWNRVAYYTSAAPAEATGLSFLANLGDPRQSGTFD